MEIRWNRLPREDWDAATPFAAWQQGWAYGAAWRAVYGPVHRAEILADGRRIGVAQLTARSFLRCFHIINCVRGPVWSGDPDAQTRAGACRLISETVPLSRLRGVMITPDQGAEEGRPLSSQKFHQVMTPYSTAMIDLTRDEDALRAAMQGKWRNRLKRAENANLHVTQADSNPGQYDWLIKADAAQQKARRYRASPAYFTTAWQRECKAPDGVVILTANQAAKRVAAMMVLIHGKGALYQVGWAGDEGRAVNAHNLLMWQMIRRLKAMGIERFDLGGIDTTENAGIARFKLGSGAEPRTLCGTWL